MGQRRCGNLVILSSQVCKFGSLGIGVKVVKACFTEHFSACSFVARSKDWNAHEPLNIGAQIEGMEIPIGLFKYTLYSKGRLLQP